MSRTALIVVIVVTAGLFLAGCGRQEQGQDSETTEQTTAAETTTEETIVEETTRQETTTGDSEQAAEVEVAPPAQAATPPPSNGESQPPDGHMLSQELGVNEAGHDVSNTPAISPAVSIVFFPVPLGNGATYSCTGGPPFVFDPMGMMGNCAVQQIGPPAGLICDIPTTITFMHDMDQFVADAGLCHSGTDAGTPPGVDLPAQAQTYPPGTESAPYSPAA